MREHLDGPLAANWGRPPGWLAVGDRSYCPRHEVTVTSRAGQVVAVRVVDLPAEEG